MSTSLKSSDEINQSVPLSIKLSFATSGDAVEFAGKLKALRDNLALDFTMTKSTMCPPSPVLTLELIVRDLPKILTARDDTDAADFQSPTARLPFNSVIVDTRDENACREFLNFASSYSAPKAKSRDKQ